MINTYKIGNKRAILVKLIKLRIFGEAPNQAIAFHYLFI